MAALIVLAIILVIYLATIFIKLGLKALKYLDYVVIAVLTPFVLDNYFEINLFSGEIHTVFVILIIAAPVALYALLSSIIRIGRFYPLKILGVLFCGFGLWSIAHYVFELDMIWSVTIGIVAAIIIGASRLADSSGYGYRRRTTQRYEQPDDDEYAGPPVTYTDYTPAVSSINSDIIECLDRRGRVVDKTNNILGMVIELSDTGAMDEADNQYIAGCFDRFVENDDKIKEYADVFNSLDSIGQRTTLARIESCVSKMEFFCDEMQNKLNEILLAKSRREEKREEKSSSGFALFAGCDTVDKLKKRYRELSKNYHPDTSSGDKEAMQAINEEYERLLKEYE